jgi:hypothetical protein
MYYKKDIIIILNNKQWSHWNNNLPYNFEKKLDYKKDKISGLLLSYSQWGIVRWFVVPTRPFTNSV